MLRALTLGMSIMGLSEASGIAAASSTSTTNAKPSHAAELHGLDADLWTTDLEDAKARAARDKRPLLLYWGAVWCPPCNELKEQVFAKARFREVAKLVIPVYLDGDGENAQLWAERLQVSGYPTVLVIGPDGTELTRLSGNLDVDEFEQALNGVIAAATPVAELLRSAANVDADGLRLLAYTSWEQLENLSLTPEEKLTSYRDLLGRSTKAPAVVQSALTARIVSELAGLAQKDDLSTSARTSLTELATQMPGLFATMTSSPDNLRAARSLLIYGYKGTTQWLFGEERGSAEYLAWRDKWLAAVERLRTDESLSIDARLWTVYPAIQAAQLQEQTGDARAKTAGSDLAVELRQLVRKEALAAERDAKSSFARHAVVSGAAYLLQLVGYAEEARSMLIKELRTTDTPWYYESSLASLEKSEGRLAQAQYWSQKARISAKGRASKIQWLVADIVLQLDLQGTKRLAELLPLLAEYYQLARGLADGFSGRNAARSQRLQGALQAHLGNDKLRRFLQSEASRCQGAECRQHFASLIGS